MKRGIWLPATAAALLLAGCAAPTTPPLYQWTGYQPQVYEYFKGQQAPQQQIDALEKALQEIRAKGHTPPPGFHAHLGMLYASVGNEQQAEQELQAEKQLFPESASYMDFLMKKKTGASKAANPAAAGQTVAGRKNADSNPAKQ
ncbi:DUF4810 domain-containing protein [Burkholderia cenocepacia]|jgi:hypothetical protein|uniref:Lipoprotein n=1 Tax=Burkholderia cenocepacia (strain ATCC BAA-245 / DSM 16553 / LMG 16656 / NCTC 13227 / J2315 / CF5610) TaxID=216591 RepID=B4E8N0_BURCJ|nr:DUF4810 domain-containing protein [Burkholderia cenocepacia]KIS47438.1 hypothetical protein NP88_3866 [Burkholderia cepacia]ERI27900.1 putative lipoprotein [Burkholderia cenocepacia BC7]KKI77778.1 lipoprotein [Burkholderia cenocepacia]MBJ9898970.1 DUF4810 domain-containing protein [Burkholderia cenocepacia]MBJ9918980.1 DUF4810 domain-containing protein [Burkholderia cenocepacia]